MKEITRGREDMNVMFEWPEFHESIKFIPSRRCVIFFYYMDKKYRRSFDSFIDNRIVKGGK